mmetsp:Transcript_31238/g.103415  ORF Transcript_31238/g.103415 Transcript_31238/m.103415 type:complete len:209 (+) Transcript_31238:86-712(+)
MSGQRNSRTRARRGVEIIALVRGAGGALRARGSSAHAVLDSLQAGDERHRQPEEGARQRAVGIEQRPGGVEHVVLWDERARHPLEAEDVCDEGHVVCVDRDAAVAHERQHAAQHLPELDAGAVPAACAAEQVRHVGLELLPRRASLRVREAEHAPGGGGAVARAHRVQEADERVRLAAGEPRHHADVEERERAAAVPPRPAEQDVARV